MRGTTEWRFSDIVAGGERYDVISLEVSSFQLEALTSFRPRVSVWLNFAPDHLDRYQSLEDYRKAKLHVFDYQREEDWAVVRSSDLEMVSPLRPSIRTFSAFEAADYTLDGSMIRRGDDGVLDFGRTQLRGTHNAENVMATLAIAEVFEISPESVLEALSEYQPPAHRCELVGKIEGHEFINDSKATNLHALESSLLGQPDPVVLIAGGKDKGLDFGEVGSTVSKHVSHALLIGEMAERIAQSWEGTRSLYFVRGIGGSG